MSKDSLVQGKHLEIFKTRENRDGDVFRANVTVNQKLLELDSSPRNLRSARGEFESSINARGAKGWCEELINELIASEKPRNRSRN